MSRTALLLVLANLSLVLMLWRRVGVNLSLSSVLICFLLLFHGPAYFYYTRIYGPDTDFYDVITSAAKGADVTPTLDLALALAFFSVCLGMLFADLATGVGVRKWKGAIRSWNENRVRVDATSRQRVVFAALALGLLLLVPFVLIDSQLPKIFEYFTSDLGEFDKVDLRREGGGSAFYLYNLALGNVVPFISFTLLAMVFAGVRNVKGVAIAFTMLVLIGKAATLSKAPLAVFALQCAVAWLLMRRLAVSWRVTLFLGLLACLLFAVMSWIANPSGAELALVFEFLFYRVFMIVNESLLEYFAAIPYVLPHSWGAQSSWIAALFQAEPRLPTYWLVSEVHRGFISSTTTVMFMGDAWADFGWAGVATVPFLAGAIVRWIDVRLIVKRGKSVATIAGVTLGHYGLFIAMSTSLPTALVTGGLAFVVPLVAMVSQRRRGRRESALAPACP